MTRAIFLLVVATAATSIVPAIASAQDTVQWDPLAQGATGSDGLGTWNTSSSIWYDPSIPGDATWTSGDNAVIGNSTGTLTSAADPLNPNTLPSTAGLIGMGTGGVTVGNITFNNLTYPASPAPPIDYSIEDTSAGGTNPLLLNNVNSNISNPTTTITSNTTSGLTNVDTSLAAASNFTLNIAGSGNIAFGGSIGIPSTRALNSTFPGSGTLNVGSAPGTGYTGVLTLSNTNNLTGTTIFDGVVNITNNGSLGSGTVNLAGGELQIIQGAIAVKLASSGTAGSYFTIASGNSAGVYATGNWVNYEINHQSAAGVSSAGIAAGDSDVPDLLGDNTGGALTTAAVSSWSGGNGAGQTQAGATNGLGQLFSSGLNAQTTTTHPATMTISNIPYANYNVYVYFWSGNANAAGDVKSGSQDYFFKSTNPTSGSLPTAYTLTNATTAASAIANADYALFSGETSGTFTATLTESAQTPWISGYEIVAAPIAISNPVSVTSSSTIKLGNYQTTPQLTGGLTIAGGSTLSFSEGNTGSTLFVNSPTSFTAAGGTLSPAAGETIELSGITDSGNGFNTSGAGTVQLTTDVTSTVSGPINVGSLVQMSLASGTSGSALGGGTLTVGSGGSIFGTGQLTNSTVTINSGGTISGNPTAAGTTSISSANIVNAGTIAAGSFAGSSVRVGTAGGTIAVNSGGSINSGVGAINLLGNTTVNSGGFTIGLTGSTGQTVTASGSLTLAGGTSTYTLSGTSTSGLIDLTTANDLFITGGHAIEAYFVSGTLPTVPGVSNTYDLINYAGSLLTTTGGNGSPLMFTDGGQGGSITFGYGSSAPAGDVVVPPSYLYQLKNVSLSGTNEIELVLTSPAPLTWTGATNDGNPNEANWDIATTQNWSTGSSPATPATYVDGEQVTFGDTNLVSNSPITNFNVNITAPQVMPGGIIFSNNLVNYTFAGGAISGATTITMNGAGTVTLQNANSFTGAVAVNDGELIAANAAALGSSSRVTVASGAALELSGGITVSNNIPLTLTGIGWSGGAAGALNSVGGANVYPGAITLAGGATINSDVSGSLTLSGGITTGANDLTFTGGGNIRISSAISSTDTDAAALNYNGTGTLTLATADTLVGGVAVNSGTMLITTGGALGSSTGVAVASGGALNFQGGITSNPVVLSIAGAGPSGNLNGALVSVGGANVYTGAITLSGAASIGSTSTTSGDGLTLTGGVNTTSNNYALSFLGAGLTTVGGGGISGGGSVTMNGSGEVLLGAGSSYSGGTTINSGTVSVAGSATALGSGDVTLAGGELQFSAPVSIGLQISTSSIPNQFNSVSPGSIAGVVPIGNWNELKINRFTSGNGPFNSGSTYAAVGTTQGSSASNTPVPFTLTSSSGQTTTAQVTFWTAQDTFMVNYTTPPTNPDAQIVWGYLDSLSTATIAKGNVAEVSVGSVPYSNYSVIVYFNNNAAGGPQDGAVTLVSPNYASPTYDYVTTGSGFPGFEQVTDTNSATPQSGNYAIFTGLSSPSFTIESNYVESFEIVNNAPLTLGNNAHVTSNSTIDLTGVSAAAMGTLSIGGDTLSITGGGTGANLPFTMSFGATTLNGNATFNVANNGTATGTLNLGAIGDGGAGFGITLNGPGTVGLASATGSTYKGPTSVSSGMLQLYDMGSNSADSATGSGTVTILGTGTLTGPTNVGGNSYISGKVSIGSGGALQITSGASVFMSGGLSLANGSATNLAFSSAAPTGTAGPAMGATSGAAPTSLAIGSTTGDAVSLNLDNTPYAVGTTSGTVYTYDVFSYTGTSLSATSSNNNQTLTFSNGATLNLGSLPSGPFTGFELVNNSASKQIDLQYMAFAESWTGDNSIGWDTSATDLNWAVGPAPTATPVSFVNTAAVIFGDTDNTTGSPINNTLVQIQSGGVQPGSVSFTNNSVMYTVSNAINPLTGADDTTGIAGSTGITVSGTGGVLFNDANSFTGPVQINAGYLAIDTTISPGGNSSVQVNGLGNTSGVTVASGAELSLGSLSESGNSYIYGITANGLSTIPLTIAGPGFSGMPNGNVGALSGAGGIITYAGEITLSGSATINANSPSTTDQLILTGGVNTAGNVLTFNGPGGATVASSISGSGGSVVNSGTGTLTLMGANSFSGGLTVSSGAVAVQSNSALGDGPVVLSGGGLNFVSGSGIGLNVASNQTNPISNPPPASYTVDSVTPTEAVGILPLYNWNNLTVVRNANGAGKIGSPAPSGGDTPAGSSVSPLALNDSSGNASGASVTAWSANNGFSVTGTGATPTFEMLASFINASAATPASITISNIPYSSYTVYLYFYNNAAAFGQASLSTSSTSYYFSGLTNNPPATLIQDTLTSNPGSNTSGYPFADYAVWGGQTGSTLIATVSQATGSGTPGLAGIQIVNDALVFSNAVTVATDTPIDITGPNSVTLGSLTIGSNLLSVTGGSTGAGMPYSLTFGATSISGSPDFNVANNGIGAATLTLGTITDSRSGDSVTINGNGGGGTVVFAGGGNYTGSTVVNSGTLRLVGALASNAGVSVDNGATLSGPTTVGSSASIAGAVTLNGNITATDGAKLSLNSGLTIGSGTATFTLAGAPSGQAIIATSGATPSLNIQASQTINIAGLPDGLPGTWTYDLYSYTGAALNPSGNGTNNLSYADGSLNLSSTPTGPFTYSLTDTGSQVDLTVKAFALRWSGPTGGNWDTTSFNWQYANPSVVSSTYNDGTSVTFADTDLNSSPIGSTSGLATVNVQPSGVNPGIVTFTNTGSAHGGVDYLIAGGPIGGSTGITLNGAGNVTLAGNNTFTGGVTINAGTLIVPSDATAAGAAAPLGIVPSTPTAKNIVINGGTLQDGAAGNAALIINANRGIALGNNSGGSGTIDVPSGGTTVVAGAIANVGPSPASLRVNGAGVLMLTGNSSFSGGTTVSSGTLAVAQSSTALGTGPVTLSGGMLSLAGIGVSGLQGTYYQSSAGAGTWFITGGASDPNIGDTSTDTPTALSGVVSYFNTATPLVKAVTTTGGQTNLSFPNVAGGNAFADQGFSGTTDYEVLLAGEIFITTPGNYTFSTASDDGSTLYLDGAQIVNNNKNHPPTSITSSAIALTAGLHQIDIGFFQAGAGAQLIVDYNGPDTGATSIPIPNSALYAPNPTQSYGDNVSLATTSSINVSGSLNASMGSLTLGGNTLNVGSTDASGSAYSLSFTGLTASGTARVNVAASSGSGPGTVTSTGPAHLAASTTLTVGSGTLAFLTNTGSASIGAGSSLAVNSGAVLQLAGTVSALYDGTNMANVGNNGSLNEVGASNQQVGIVSGTSSTDVNGATIYAGNTTAGDGTNAATLVAAQILQNTLTIAANSTVAIVPSGPSGPAVSSSVASDSSSAAAASSSSSGSTGDAYAAIEAALASSSSSHDAVTELRSLESSDPGLTLTPGDDVDLYHNFQLASNGVSLGAANSGAAATPTLLSDLANDGLTPAEISSLVGSAADPAPVTLGGIGSLSPSLAIGGSTAAVPEPSTLLLAALGLGALGFSLRRRVTAELTE